MQTKIYFGDRSTSRRGTFVVVITRPGLPEHIGLFAQITYKVVWADYFLSWSAQKYNHIEGTAIPNAKDMKIVLLHGTENLLLHRLINWHSLLKPQRLKALVDKMTTVELRGTFSPQQLEAVRSSPGVQTSLRSISKGVHV